MWTFPNHKKTELFKRMVYTCIPFEVASWANPQWRIKLFGNFQSYTILCAQCKYMQWWSIQLYRVHILAWRSSTIVLQKLKDTISFFAHLNIVGENRLSKNGARNLYNLLLYFLRHSSTVNALDNEVLWIKKLNFKISWNHFQLFRLSFREPTKVHDIQMWRKIDEL